MRYGFGNKHDLVSGKWCLQTEKKSLETKKKVVGCYVMSALLYDKELLDKMRRKLEVVEMWIFRGILEILWTD